MSSVTGGAHGIVGIKGLSPWFESGYSSAKIQRNAIPPSGQVVDFLKSFVEKIKEYFVAFRANRDEERSKILPKFDSIVHHLNPDEKALLDKLQKKDHPISFWDIKALLAMNKRYFGPDQFVKEKHSALEKLSEMWPKDESFQCVKGSYLETEKGLRHVSTLERCGNARRIGFI